VLYDVGREAGTASRQKLLRPEEAKHGAVFANHGKIFWLIRVSRYNVYRKQRMGHGIVILLTVLERSAYTYQQLISKKAEEVTQIP
jgi:hypothetical protein